ncbi:M23 family metallopeptidase [Actinacidiphila bryophytorum]|uniref:Murein DD-endopeptidase MepM and murein hydrolase activator NlpD, contain LysM domain n=1 Tax=Actinacidiphila bryophytorum TaxID=1436133 RepID=A0A9W4E145_9ACTN|nr:M23 family metallopeptidase [Actinacidiphila bryophytorum]CAG7600479.1 Murein DD-endopeptidase MepM and murein hydrolase activator NlpD, contain LysM domain [Actinacidiphila bryophytorum]
MNERHPSGYSPDYDAYAYDACSTGSYQAVGTLFADDTTTGTYGYIPQQTPPPYGYDQPAPQQAQTQDYTYGTGYGFDYGQAQQQHQPEQQSYDPYGYPSGATYYDTGTYDAQQFASYQQPYEQPQPQAYDQSYGQPYEQAYPQQPQVPQQSFVPQQDWDSGAYPTYGYGYDAGGDTGIYEQFPPQQPYEQQHQPQHDYAYEYREPEAEPQPQAQPEPATALLTDEVRADDGLTDGGDEPEAAAERHDFAADDADRAYEPGVPVARSRRRKPAKRSALLTVAVPSVAVMGVAAVGAAAVTGVGMAQDSGGSHADTQAAGSTGKAPTTQLDRQLAGVSQDANDFADRASRTQERIDLKDRQAAAKRAADAAAARKEALRPKFVLPVKQKGLSAYFGQAGVNWMALHTGIDFPVMVGTPVMAVTDGTVRTQWNSSYGNMAIVTAPDGTETWYCHLSSTKIRSGSVKAGTVIAYSGNTGNTTGPHLHLEVRPGGGSPIDPLPWLLKHGLDPR